MDDVHFPQFLCLMKNPETEKVFRRKGPAGCSCGTGIDIKRNLPGKTIRTYTVFATSSCRNDIINRTR